MTGTDRQVNKGNMAMHRPGQGKIVRLSALGLLVILSLFLYVGLERFLNAYELGGILLLPNETYDITLPRAIGLLVAVVMLWFSWRWTQTKPKSVDFLVDVEGEMRKVVWPINPEGRTFGEKTRELRTSSFVVLGVVLFLAYTLFMFDAGFRLVFGLILGESGS